MDQGSEGGGQEGQGMGVCGPEKSQAVQKDSEPPLVSDYMVDEIVPLVEEVALTTTPTTIKRSARRFVELSDEQKK